MTFKNHTCCGHTFAAIDGALALQAQHGPRRAGHRARQGRHLQGGARKWRATRSRAPPAEARFSLKYVVATALTHGSVRFAAFEPARLERPGDARADARAWTWRSTRSSTRRFPAQRAARVAIERARRPARGVPAAHAHRRSGRAALGCAARGEVPGARGAGARRARAAPARCLRSASWRSSERGRRAGAAVNLAQALFAPRAVALVGASGDATQEHRAPAALPEEARLRRAASCRSIPRAARCWASAPTRASPRRRAASTTPS